MPTPLMPQNLNVARASGREKSFGEASKTLQPVPPLTEPATHPSRQNKYSVRAGKARSHEPASTQNNQLACASGREESFEEASKTLQPVPPLAEPATHPSLQNKPSVRAGKERSDEPASTQNLKLARASGREKSFEEASKPCNQSRPLPNPLPIPPGKTNLACQRVRSNATHLRALKTPNSPARADENRASKKRPKPCNQARPLPNPLPIPPGNANIACERVRSKATHPRALKTTNSPAQAGENRASKKRPNPW
jgi:hypothetical protein